MAVWFVLLVLAFVNGGFREAVLIPRLGTTWAHIGSTALLCLLILVLTALTIRWLAPNSTVEALQIGLLWTAMTIAFEFLAGHYVFGTPWSKLLEDYNIAKGRVWILVPLTTAIAPWLLMKR